MLTLTRNEGQRICIGDDIVVEVVRVRRGERVSLGITAPPNVRIDREEVRLARLADERALAEWQTEGGR